MIHRIIGNLAIIGLFLLTLAIFAKYAHAQHVMSHDQYHPKWLRESGCCDPDDMRKVTVRYLPGVGWAIVAIDNPHGYSFIRLTKPIRFNLENVRRSKDGNWWAGLRVIDGVAVGVWLVGTKPCVFGHESGQ